MKTIKIQEVELNEARELQKKCIDLHLPVPPVVLWDATIIDKDGNAKERTIAKANSYVRNALNVLARYVGMVSPSIVNTREFKDGNINVKSAQNTLTDATLSALTFYMALGDSLTPNPETLDYYQIPVTTGKWTGAGSLTYTQFEETSRKLITQYIAVMVNASNDVQYISEAAIYNVYTASQQVLMLRDVFTPIAVGAGESIRFVYQTEVLYPL